MRIAVLFDNFGPYHLGRLNAAAEVCDLLGIELASTSAEYAWKRELATRTFRSETLFADRRQSERIRRELRPRLVQVLAKFAPDAVAIPGWSSRLAVNAVTWCNDERVPVIVMSESTALDEARVRWKEAIKRRYVALCGAGLVGGVMHRDYLMQLGMPAEQILYGYNAVDNAYFQREAALVRGNVGEHRQRLNLPERYFLASARFIAKKNLPGLLAAYAKYRQDCCRDRCTTGGSNRQLWDLVLLGDGEARGELEAMRSQLDLQASVHLPGFVQYAELPAYYALAGAFVHASTVEPWGLVVNEAMASGLPVAVSNRCGCAPSLVVEGRNGFTFDPADVPGMADCLSRTARLSEAERQAMGAASESLVDEFGPRQFGAGLRQAAECARRESATRKSVLNSALLSVLQYGRG